MEPIHKYADQDDFDMAIAIARQLCYTVETDPSPIEVARMAATILSGAFAGNQLIWTTTHVRTRGAVGTDL